MVGVKVLFLLHFMCFSYPVMSRPAQGFHSDVIVTHWPTTKPPAVGIQNDDDENQPGFVKRQLIRFGKVASKIGNSMGSHASKIAQAAEKICEVIKTVIPLLTAVCHVGQFKFCAATTQAPGELSDALNPGSLDLDNLDR